MTNGTLKYKLRPDSGFDILGDPIPAPIEWSDEIDCFIQTNQHNTKGKTTDGKFIMSAYTIFIDSQEIDTDLVSLTTDRGKALGEFQVQDIQFLDLVQRVKLTV